MVSGRHMYVQFVDDDKGVTLASVSTLGGESPANIKCATELGKAAAGRAIEKGIGQVVIDRGGYKFHGRVKAIVDAMTAAGVVIRAEAEEEK
jgi:large subunit ribosomal protein L18